MILGWGSLDKASPAKARRPSAVRGEARHELKCKVGQTKPRRAALAWTSEGGCPYVPSGRSAVVSAEAGAGTRPTPPPLRTIPRTRQRGSRPVLYRALFTLLP